MSPIPAALALGLAYFVSWGIAKRVGAPSEAGRYGAVDGLRGDLAFFVFLHHVSIWYGYQRIRIWEAPPSNLYINFGEAGVALFFSVTGFLFFDKLLSARGKEIDWLRLYVSRFMRLTPLYLVAVTIMFCLVFTITGGVLRVSAEQLIVSMLRWLAFGMLGEPDLNGLKNPGLMAAGVVWTLSYELLFYFMLPLFGLMLRVSVSGSLVAISVASIYLTFRTGRTMPALWAMFLIGMTAAVLRRSEKLSEFGRSTPAALVALTCLGVSLSAFDTSRGPVQVLLLGFFFYVVAAGNSLFGVLVSAASRSLGKVAYSIYLLHGFLLFATFSFIVGPHSVLQHWMVLLALTPVLICVCHCTFYVFERPGIEATTRVTMRLRQLLPRRLTTSSRNVSERHY